MCDEISNNPFAALFSSVDDVRKIRNENLDDNRTRESELKLSLVLSKKLEEVLNLTLDEEIGCCSVLLDITNFGKNHGKVLGLETVRQALFERLMLDDVLSNTVCKCNGNQCKEVSERKPLFYLYQCYYRSERILSNVEEKKAVMKIIASQSAMFVSNPDMFPQLPDPGQLIDLIESYQYMAGHSECLSDFIIQTANCVVATSNSEDAASLKDVLQPPLKAFQKRLQKLSLQDKNLFLYLDLLQYFLKNSELSTALLEFSFPKDRNNARSYQDTILGSFFSCSCLPKKSTDPYEFFLKPSQYSLQEHSSTEQSLWTPTLSLIEHLEAIFYTLLKQSPKTKELLLTWIGKCMNANSSKSKLWNAQMRTVFDAQFCSDGFMITLGAVLLRLCKPFSDPHSPKLLKIQPSYCKATDGNGTRLEALAKETCLITIEDKPKASETQYNFITEIFYFCHFAQHIGFKASHEHLTKLGQELGRIQRLYEEARLQEGGENSATVEHIQENMEKGMTQFLTLRAALKEPDMLNNMLMFHIATATWLINAAISNDSFHFAKLSFPLDTNVPENLSYAPEFLVENIKDCAQFMRQFSPSTFEISYEFMQHLMSLILVFMGSPERMKNPHLRANLAELLETLLPSKEGSQTVFSTDVYKKELFTSHPHVKELVPTLLHVFVSIEMTGQSVAFEQKFQYRRPMYAIFDYIRLVDLHRERIQTLSIDAEIHAEDTHPPLFLRFINLLINDANFLLDESLDCMSKLKEKQVERDSGQWGNLSATERHEKEASLQHMGMLARFHNVMGNDTIQTLQWLTADFQSIFCHPVLLDRFSAMLNYFLMHLVGPKKKNFKVKDMGQYDFKPHDLVENICLIFIHLGSKLNKKNKVFCAAVSRDGRSYRPELFKQAKEVLKKIGKPVVASQLNEIAIIVQRLGKEAEVKEANLIDVPEEFLDPIMSTLMTDPVRLPSSGKTLDRATIARHLLSDQIDPYNRSPLSMDMLIPDVELRERIQNWVREHK